MVPGILTREDAGREGRVGQVAHLVRGGVGCTNAVFERGKVARSGKHGGGCVLLR